MSIHGQSTQNGDFEDGPTVTNLNQISNADYWGNGCEGNTSLYDCNAPPIFGLPGPSPVATPAECVYPRLNGSPNCRFGSIRCYSTGGSASGSAMNELSGFIQSGILYEIQLYAARGTKPPAASQPTFRRIEAVLRTGNCDDEIIVPLPIDIPFGDCDWIKLSGTFSLNSNEASFGFNHIEFREIPQIVWHGEEIYIDDVELLNIGLASIDSEAPLSNLNRLVSVYPNPTSSEIKINFEGEVSRVVITDITGNELISALDLEVISVKELVKGMYFVRVYTDNFGGNYVQAFMKE